MDIFVGASMGHPWDLPLDNVAFYAIIYGLLWDNISDDIWFYVCGFRLICVIFFVVSIVMGVPHGQ